MAIRRVGISGYAISGGAISGLVEVEEQAAVVAVTQDSNTIVATGELLAQGTTTATQVGNTITATATVVDRSGLVIKVGRKPRHVFQAAYLNLNCHFRNDVGVLVAPDSVVFKLYSPTGTTTTYTHGTDDEIQNASTGDYRLDFQIGQYAGRWHYIWIATYQTRTYAHEGSIVVQTSPFYEQSSRNSYRRVSY